jgi:hypothetical protein
VQSHLRALARERVSRVARLAVAGIVGCCAAVFFYATLRIVETLVIPEPSPALVVWSARSGYFWRLVFAGYLAGAVTIHAYAFVGVMRVWRGVVRRLEALLWAVFVLLMVQGIVCP